MSAEPRYRSRGSDPTTYTLDVTGTVTDTAGPFVRNQVSETMSDVVTHGYNRKVRNGAIINHYCEYDKSEVDTVGIGSMHFVKGVNNYWHNGAVTAYRLANEQDPPDVVLSATGASQDESRFYAVSAMDPTPHAYGEDIGEIMETLRFLRNPLHSLRGIANSISALKNQPKKFFRNRSYKRSLQLEGEDVRLGHALAEAWATYRFAAAPLVRTLHEGYEHLKLPKEKHKTRRLRKTARGFSEGGSDGSLVSSVNSAGGTVTKYIQTKSLRQRYHSAILYEIINPIHDWRYELGIREKDLPETVWQLLPYSFMIDRVSNISRSIRGIMNLADPSLKVLAASTTMKSTSIRTVQLTSRTSTGWTISGSGETRIFTDFKYKREPWTPTPRDTLPGFKPKELINTATEVADLASLVLQALR